MKGPIITKGQLELARKYIEAAADFDRTSSDEGTVGKALWALLKFADEANKSADGAPISPGQRLFYWVAGRNEMQTLDVPPGTSYCWYSSPEVAKAAATLSDGWKGGE